MLVTQLIRDWTVFGIQDISNWKGLSTRRAPVQYIRERVKKWTFKMAFTIRRRPPPLDDTNFQTFLYANFFLLQLNPTYMKWILHLVKNITLAILAELNKSKRLFYSCLAFAPLLSFQQLWPLEPVVNVKLRAGNFYMFLCLCICVCLF